MTKSIVFNFKKLFLDDTYISAIILVCKNELKFSVFCNFTSSHIKKLQLYL